MSIYQKPISNYSKAEINESHFIEVLEKLGLSGQLNGAALFQILDSDGDGLMQTQELVCGLSVLSGGTLEERLRLIFDAFDTERVGHLGPEQVRLMMQHDMWRQDHGPTQSPAVPHRRHRNGEQDDEGIEMQPMGPDCDRDLAHMICQTLDWNSDGRITFAEFACAIRSVPELALTLEATLKPQSLPHWQYVPEAHCSSCAEPLQEVGGGFHCPKCSPTPETPKGRKLFGFIGSPPSQRRSGEKLATEDPTAPSQDGALPVHKRITSKLTRAWGRIFDGPSETIV
jgi:Ca2+-binding EF-hand superfamily protein